MAKSASKKSTRKPAAKRSAPKEAQPRKSAAKPKLLSGGNPQIPKGYGDAPVQAYIAAAPGWKRDLARQLDSIIEHAVPKVLKAVKWNSPMYGLEEDTYFLSYHCYDRFIKVAFFRG